MKKIKTTTNSLRDNVLYEVEKQYGVLPESPWPKDPESIVLRHTDNGKWFAIMMKVSRHTLGIDEDSRVSSSNGSSYVRFSGGGNNGSAGGFFDDNGGSDTGFFGGGNGNSDIGFFGGSNGNSDIGFFDIGSGNGAADRIDIMNVKAEPEAISLLCGIPGYLPAYHMNKEHWITIRLDGSVTLTNILPLLDASFSLTASKTKPKKQGKRITNWLIPANPKFYDIQSELEKNPNEPFLWKQGRGVAVGNIVYMYLASPVRAVLYKCRVLETNIPYKYTDENLSMNHAMRLKLLSQYKPDYITMERLNEHGVYAVRGPRSMPESLIDELNLND